ncbi:MAG: outer membrane beta-barrel protein [Rhodoblastus sp.]
MGKFTALSLAGFVSVAAFGPALAADLLPPPPPVEAPVLAPAMDTSGWYLRGDVGVGVTQISGLRSTLQPAGAILPPPTAFAQSSIEEAAIIGAGVGYQINNWFRTDITAEYRRQAQYRAAQIYTAGCATTYCADNYNAKLSSGVFLANGYVDLGTWGGLTPYVGAGVGLARHRLAGLTDTGLGYGYAADTIKTNFAWALMAGAAFDVTRNLKLDLGYRYLNMGPVTSNPIACNAAPCFYETQSYKLSSHDFRLGFRYMLADAGVGPMLAPSAPIFGGHPGPLVRKY